MAGVTGRRARRQRAFRWAVLAVLGVFFLLPLVAMVEFSTRDDETWPLLVNWPRLSEAYPDLAAGIVASLGQATLTTLLMLVLLVPTAVWVRLRLPRLRPLVEFLCLLPLTIPAIVLVVGLAPVYAWVNYFLGGSSLTLVFAYTILVLPYAYRAIDTGLSAIDGVVDVHDLHVWTLTSEMEVATAHLMIAAGIDSHTVLDRARALLAERHGITHATLQVEPDDHRGCDEVSW